MDIVSLVAGFAKSLLRLQEGFCKDNRLDRLEKEAVKLGTRTIADFLVLTLTETDELIRTSGLRKRDYTIQRKVERTLTTTTGDVTFTRTLFRSRRDGSYHFLLDELMGLPAHERFSELAESKVLEKASEGSYQKAADSLKVGEQTITKTAVMEKVHGIRDSFIEEESLPEGQRKWCEYLYIEADEDHIHEQGGERGTRGFLGKLVYLYEGKEAVCRGKRILVAPYYQGGLYSGSAGNRELWEKVQRYISGHYNTETLKRVYISGDGANWIKAGTDYVAKSVFVADRFHLMQYINRVSNLTMDDAGLTKHRLYKYIYQNKLSAAKKLLTRIENHCGGDEAVEACRSYLINNWEAIQRTFHDKNVLGCSAEGHVSHMYSDRMSSRPMGWSECGSDAMCHLRCFTKNHGSEGILDLVHYRRQKELEKLPATGTEGMVEVSSAVARRTTAEREMAPYWERLQASIGGMTVRKTLAIRNRLNEI